MSSSLTEWHFVSTKFSSEENHFKKPQASMVPIAPWSHQISALFLPPIPRQKAIQKILRTTWKHPLEKILQRSQQLECTETEWKRRVVRKYKLPFALGTSCCCLNCRCCAYLICLANIYGTSLLLLHLTHRENGSFHAMKEAKNILGWNSLR